MDLSQIDTESRNQNSMHLDEMSTLEILEVMNQEDAKVALAVHEALPQVGKLVDQLVNAFQDGGRLIYMGAGTSGRLGVLDASECVPTFGVDPSMVIGLIAGDDEALRTSIEGAEDSRAMGREDLEAIPLTPKDVVVGIAASGRTPYVLGGLAYANQLGCVTASIANSHGSAIGELAQIPIEVVVGPEVLTGSTRLKSGTAQKMILNMISTASMVRLGKAYENLMVDVVPSNEKLQARAEGILMETTGVSREEATAALRETGGEVKTAMVVLMAGVSVEEARYRIDQAHGHVRQAVGKVEDK